MARMFQQSWLKWAKRSAVVRDTPCAKVRAAHGGAIFVGKQFLSPEQKKENLMYTKTELHEGTRVVLSAMQYLEKMYGPASGAEIDMRPWVSGDHPI
jgi:hypothetical protein